MSTLILAVVGILLVCMAARGFHRGFLRSALSMLSLILTIVLVGLFHTAVTEALKSYTPLADSVERAVYTNMMEKADEILPTGEEEASVTVQEQNQWLEDCGIPAILQEEIQRESTQAAENFAESVSRTIADAVLNVLGFLISFLLAFILIRLLISVSGIVNHIPILRGLNRWLGAAFGLIQGIVLVWILCLVLTLILPSDTGSRILAAIGENPLLTFLYNGSLRFGRIL